MSKDNFILTRQDVKDALINHPKQARIMRYIDVILNSSIEYEEILKSAIDKLIASNNSNGNYCPSLEIEEDSCELINCKYGIGSCNNCWMNYLIDEYRELKAHKEKLND